MNVFKNNTTAAFVIGLAIPAAALAPPDEATVAELAANHAAAPGASKITATFGVAGDNDEQYLFVVRFTQDYSDEVYAALLVWSGDRWELTSLAGPLDYYHTDEDVPAGKIRKISGGGRNYYEFTCAEVSSGSGGIWITENMVLYRIAGGELKEVYSAEKRVTDEVFNRWYGGDDATAWQDGGFFDSLTEYELQDVDRDGEPELWAITRTRNEAAGQFRYEYSNLYALGEDGTFSIVAIMPYKDFLVEMNTWEANALLAEGALTEEGDARAALAYLEKAAAMNPTEAGLKEKAKLAQRLANDPAEAVTLFFRDEWETLKKLYPKSGATTEMAINVGNFNDLMRILKEKKRHPRWTEAFENAVTQTIFGPAEDKPALKDLNFLKDRLPGYLAATREPYHRAQILTYLGDAFYQAGAYDTARGLYEQASREGVEGNPFYDYALYRAALCASARREYTLALDNLLAAIQHDGWWAWRAAEEVIGFATLQLPNGEKQSLLDYLSAGHSLQSSAVADVNGDSRHDLMVVLSTDVGDENRAELLALYRADDTLEGPVIATGDAFYSLRVSNPFTSGPPLVTFDEVKEKPDGIDTFLVLLRYDGAAWRETARVLTTQIDALGETLWETPTVNFIPGATPEIHFAHVRKNEGQEEQITANLIWSPGEFKFIPTNP